jgi:hypothetical protein
LEYNDSVRILTFGKIGITGWYKGSGKSGPFSEVGLQVSENKK